MTNYLEEKTDKDCTFEGLQGSLLLGKVSTFKSISAHFRKADGRFFSPFNTVSAEKKKKRFHDLMINPGLVLTSGFFFFLLFERYDKEGTQLPEESHDCRV